MRPDTKLIAASLFGVFLATVITVGSVFVPSALHVGFLLTIALVVFGLSMLVGSVGLLWYGVHTAMDSATGIAYRKHTQLRHWVEDAEADSPLLRHAPLSAVLASTDPRPAEQQTADRVSAIHSRYVEGELDDGEFEAELTELLVDDSAGTDFEERERVFEELR